MADRSETDDDRGGQPEDAPGERRDAGHASEGASSFVLRLLGVTSLLYAPWDIVSDLILRSVPASDASALARMTGIPAIAWGVLWLAASVVIGLAAIRRIGVRS